MTGALVGRGRDGAASLRVGDAEREAAVTALGEHYVAGRLDPDEFDARTTAAYAARTRGDVDALFADLPMPRPSAPDLPAARRPAAAPVLPIFPLLVLVGVVVLVITQGFFPLIALVWFAGRRRRAWR